jgi:23S rRNA (pseudouridine1915-N3)-methyltransferase
MRLHIFAIGKLKPGPELDLAKDYETRIGQLSRKAGLSKCVVADWTESQRATDTQRKTEEAAQLRERIPKGAVTVALDERGKTMASREFADFMQRQIGDGTLDLVFLIGGPDGHDPEFVSQASHKLAFGKMTWPHRLVRVMLLEQIYRALTILLQHPYHRA